MSIFEEYGAVKNDTKNFQKLKKNEAPLVLLSIL